MTFRSTAFRTGHDFFVYAIPGMPIPESVYTASSNSERAPNSKTVEVSGRAEVPVTAWSPTADDQDAYIQVSFDTRVTAIQLLVQGSLGGDQWTETVEITYTTSETVNNAVWEQVYTVEGTKVRSTTF